MLDLFKLLVLFLQLNMKSKLGSAANYLFYIYLISRIMNTPLECEKVPMQPTIISGNRIVDLGYILSWAIKLQYDHSKICTCGEIYVQKEISKDMGLTSCIIFACTQCDVIIRRYTENPQKTVSEINYGAVWGTMATGSTCGHLEEQLSCMNIPPMPANMFYNIEKILGLVSIGIYQPVLNQITL